MVMTLKQKYFTDKIMEIILVTLAMEALDFSETSVLKRASRHSIPEVAILHSMKSLKPSNTFYEEWCLLGCYAVWLL
jgi:hypothetical protein